MNGEKLNFIWQEALKEIKKSVSDPSIFETFFVKSKIDKIEKKDVFIKSQTEFSETILKTKYAKEIKKQLDKILEGSYNYVFSHESDGDVLEKESQAENYQSFFQTELKKDLTFENFVVGPSNQQANHASLAVALEPGKYLNPLFIYGKSGVGKTHLIHSIGNYLRDKNGPDYNIYYTSSEDFVDLYVHSIRNELIDSLKKKFREIDVFLIDDIQFLSGKEKTSEMFFHIFNRLISNEKQIVITSDRPPSDLKRLEERLVSRFESGLSVSISNPEYETALKILKKKVELYEFNPKRIDDAVLDYIVKKFSKDVRQLEGALKNLLFYVNVFKKNVKKVDYDLALEALKGLAPKKDSFKDSGVSIDKIKINVADYYKISVSQLVSSSRKSNITTARHIAMYLCRFYLNTAFEKIGQEFGNRDHSTVMSAYNKVDKLFRNDPNYKQVLEDIKIMLK